MTQEADRELLEFAAKAAGIDAELHPDPAYDDDGMWLKGARSPDNSKYWNPLTRDGDALRLAVQCGIEVSFVDDEPDRDGRDTRACAGYAITGDPRIRYVFEDHRGDIFAATRRAIVRAAAAIGKEMP